MAGFEREVKKALEDAGCRFHRQGKGDHEIWYSPVSKNISRSMALSNPGTPQMKH